MIRIAKFRAADLAELDLQDAQQDLRSQFGDPAYGSALEATQAAFTARDESGAVLCCAGVHEVWPGRGVAWALISRHAGPEFRAIHRAASGFLAQSQLRRIEMVVDANFPAGKRWAKMLGMTPEGTMKAYSPAGDDYVLYARIR